MEIIIKKEITPKINLTPNVKKLCRIFGLTTDDINRPILNLDLRLKLKPGSIIFITGPSGCGKSVLLRETSSAIDAKQKVDINHIPLPETGALIDRFKNAPNGIKMLSCMGLPDVTAMLLPPSLLSEGQKYRYRFARALDLAREFVIADEFCSALDKVTAGLLCMKIRQIADKTGIVFILAGHTRGLMPDLLPDCIVKVHSTGAAEMLLRQTDTDLYRRV